MTTPWSSQEPSTAAAGESEQDFPADGPFDEAAQEPLAESEEENSDEGEAALEPEQQIEADIGELAARAELADEYLLLAQRTQADFENYRKRAARDAALAQERGIAKLAKELLPAIDNLERAVQAVDGLDGDAQIVNGLKLVHAEVLAALGRAGIEPFSPDGEQFDPQHHEAVAQNRVDGAAPGSVLEVYQQGYRLGETVLRPARVLVAA